MTPNEAQSGAKKSREGKKHRGVYEKVPGSGIWWVRYTADGRIRREKVGRKSDAIILYQQRKAETRAGMKLPSNMRHRGETLAKIIERALDWYKEHRPKSYRTAKTHLETIKAEMGERIAADLSPDDVDVWLSSHEDWSPATKNRYKATLGKALQKAVISGHLGRNVARLVEARKENNLRERYLSADEERRIIDAIKGKYPDSYVHAFTIALHTGMRQTEQFMLTWEKVDFKQLKIYLRQSETKGGKAHGLPMNKACCAAMKALHEKRSKKTNRVFLSARYKDQPLENPRQWFPDVIKDAGVKDFHWHDLRHTFCSRLVQRGIPLQTVCKLANHSSIAVTLRYAHLAPQQIDDAVNVLDEPEHKVQQNTRKISTTPLRSAKSSQEK